MRSDSSIQLVNGGYCDWVHASERLREHERAREHLSTLVQMCERGEVHGRIDRSIAFLNFSIGL